MTNTLASTDVRPGARIIVSEDSDSREVFDAYSCQSKHRIDFTDGSYIIMDATDLLFRA